MFLSRLPAGILTFHIFHFRGGGEGVVGGACVCKTPASPQSFPAGFLHSYRRSSLQPDANLPREASGAFIEHSLELLGCGPVVYKPQQKKWAQGPHAAPRPTTAVWSTQRVPVLSVRVPPPPRYPPAVADARDRGPARRRVPRFPRLRSCPPLWWISAEPFRFYKHLTQPLFFLKK